MINILKFFRFSVLKEKDVKTVIDLMFMVWCEFGLIKK